MTTLEEVTSYNGRSSDRRRPAGPSQSTIRLYDLMVSRPEGITVDEAAEHLSLGFPTDQYRAYSKRVKVISAVEEGPSNSRIPGPHPVVYGSQEFKRRAHRWHAADKLAAMVSNGTASRDGDRWFAARAPYVVVQGRRIQYIPGSDAAKMTKGVEVINMITVLRRIQRRLKQADEQEAIEWAIRRIQGKA